MKVGDSKGSSHSNRSEEKKEVLKKDPPASQESKPKVTFQKDSFEAVKSKTVAEKPVLNALAVNQSLGTSAGSSASASTTKLAAPGNAPSTPSTTAADAKAILETGKNNPTEAADQLAQKLMDPAIPQSEKEALVTSIIEQDPNTAAQILDKAGRGNDPTGKLNDAERKAIATTV